MLVRDLRRGGAPSLGALSPPVIVTPGAEATVFLARTSGLDRTHTNAYATLINSLVAAGVWANLDLLYILATADTTTASLNLVSALFPLSAVNAPTFTVDQGYAGNGSTSYLETSWAPATNAIKYTQNSAEIDAYCLTSAQSGNAYWGIKSAAAIQITGRNGSDLISYRVNQAAGSSIGASTDGKGFFSAVRTASSVTQGYKNGVAVGVAGATTSAALTISTMTIGVANNAFSAAQVAAVSAGVAQVANLPTFYAAIHTYMVSVGADT